MFAATALTLIGTAAIFAGNPNTTENIIAEEHVDRIGLVLADYSDESQATSAVLDASTESTPSIHVVKEGDNLWKISSEYYDSGKEWKKLITKDGGKLIHPGDVVQIP